MEQNLTIAKAAEGLRAKKFSSLELTESYLKRIEEIDGRLNTYVSVFKEEALEQAKDADLKLSSGRDLNDLTGVPTGLKDIFNTKNFKTTCCSKMIRDYLPPYDASVVERLKDAGMVMLGKTNMDEFACGASTEHSCFGVTKNPWNTETVAGGSSGGSAAAVAADLCVYSLGTDTGGSIRQPASLCGVVGLKVTYGRVSRSGVTAFASSWDTIGPITKTVKDAAIVLKNIAGHDKRDSTTPPVDVPDYVGGLNESVKGLKIGVPKEYFGEGLQPDVEEKVREAIKQYEKMGATVKDVSLPYSKYGVAVYYIASPAELSANLARFDSIRFGSKPEGEVKDMIDYYYKSRSQGFGDEIKRRIMMGTYVLSAGYYDAYYKKAQKVRTLISEDFKNVFKDVDVLMAPVSPFPAFKIGEKKDDPLSMYLADIFTIPVSCAGVPALSLPCGFTKDGLPVGLQIIGPQWSEDKLLQTGYAYEQETDWHNQKPTL